MKTGGLFLLLFPARVMSMARFVAVMPGFVAMMRFPFMVGVSMSVFFVGVFRLCSRHVKAEQSDQGNSQ